MCRKLCVLVAAFFSVIVIPSSFSFGWIGTGHMVVALVAWEDLTPKTRAAVTDLLKQHARYQKDLLEDLPAGSTAEETDRFAFAKAATWPDMVRSPENPMHATHNHPAWHYIDIPYFHGVPEKAERASNQSGPHNVVDALQQCSLGMKDESISAPERAVDVCWIEHLVGDIHQPLHAVSLYSPDHPQGDKGGNDDEVLRDPPYPNSMQNLHFVWDSLPGDFHSEMMAHLEAVGLRADPKFSRDQLKPLLGVKDFMAWAKESHQLAIEDGYLNGQLETAVVRKGAEPDADSVPGLPPGYLEKAEVVAMHQVALGGYRLADLLNAAFDPKP